MGSRRGRDILVGLVLWMPVGIPTCLGASYEETHASLRAGNPPGLSLSLRLDREVFSIGQRIDVTLDFENTSETTYRVSTQAQDRSGRLHNIQFHVDGPPQGFADPLALYFAFGTISGGLGGAETLGQSSQSFVLNDWVRFEQPGTYRVYCTTTRVEPVDGPLCSQIVTLDIAMPDDAWIADQVQDALDGLKSAEREERLEAVRTLRLLDEPRAMATLVSSLGEDDMGSEAFLALVGTRTPLAARQALLDGIREPDTVVDDRYMWALGIVSADPEGPILAYDAADRDALRRQNEHLRAAQNAAVEEGLAALSAALALKRGRAKPVSSLTLIHRDTDSVELRQTVAETFLLLTEREQRNVLGYQWERVRCPAFQGALEEILRRPGNHEEWNAPQIRSWALLRYLEVQPEKARESILEDMRRTRPMLAGEVLLALPDEQLPQLDDVFAAHLADRNAHLRKLLPLIERYASERLLPAVIGLYREHAGAWACSIQEHALGYWVKHDPEAGLDAVRQAALLRARTGCYRSVLGNVLSRYYSPQAERLALSFINDRDNDVVVNVVRLFKQHGSAAVIDPLLMRLASLSAENDAGPPTELFSQEAIRREILLCLLDERDRPWTDVQKRTLYSLLNTDSERAKFTRRFPGVAAQQTR